MAFASRLTATECAESVPTGNVPLLTRLITWTDGETPWAPKVEGRIQSHLYAASAHAGTVSDAIRARSDSPDDERLSVVARPVHSQ